MFNSPQAEDLRAFFRDKLGLPSFDVGNGWLIFPPDGEVGFHPGDGATHQVSLRCDDIEATVAELRERGVEFTGDPDAGSETFIVAPGDLHIQLCQR